MSNRIKKSQATQPVFWEPIPLSEFHMLCILVALQGREEADLNSVKWELCWLLSSWRASMERWSEEGIAEILMYGRPGYDDQSQEEVLELLGNHIGQVGPTGVAPYYLNNFIDWAWGCYIPWTPETDHEQR